MFSDDNLQLHCDEAHRKHLKPSPFGAIHLRPRRAVNRRIRSATVGQNDRQGDTQHRRQLMASLTGLPTRLSIPTSASIVNLAAFLFTTSDTRGREIIRISAASACFK
jgi:hypothetical protein